MELTVPLPTVETASAEPPVWADLVRAHNHRVVLFLVAKGLSVDRAGDLAQETWARLLAQHGNGRLEYLEMPGLALRQAGFLFLDERRRYREETGDLREAEALSDPADSAENRLLSREQLLRARAALLTCSPRAQSVFRAVYEDPGLAHGEVAARFGLSVQRVRQTLCEVRAAIRRSLEQHDV